MIMLANSQDSQPKIETEDSTGTSGRSFCNDGWPRRQCHSRV